ncbi:carbohydrate-binding protein [Roseibacillus ishigakijimensis]|uniref:Carbohydrate-binding protein n=2 Tax=Roseibacillus ishigakijimensis TaxID=454146 RepID=A0A934RRH5_9BACT|nr:carbohydrate-binding protein [Roseibacillus ishigakijimensis]
MILTQLRPALVLGLLSLHTSAADLNWTGATSSDWEIAANWDSNTQPAEGDVLRINSGTVTFDSDREVNYNSVLLDGATLTFQGGLFKATAHPNWQNTVDGTASQEGATVHLNQLQVGTGNGKTGLYQVTAGELLIARGLSGSSIFLGGNKANDDGGTGTFEISGGSLLTRGAVQLGSTNGNGAGTFAVLGSQASSIGIGANNEDSDGAWNQLPGSTLRVGVDFGGVTPIVIHDGSGDESGTAAVFENGTLLDVSYYAGASGGGTWTVLELENGDIVDNGLAFAPGVDTSVWSFAIDNSGNNGLLTVTSNEPVNRDVYWDGSENSDWGNPANWTNNFGVADGKYVHIESGTIDYTEANGLSANLRGFRMTGGTLNLSGGEIQAAELSSAYSNLDGTVNQTGGEFGLNALEIGRTVGNDAHYNLSNGELRIGRARNGYSLFLGAHSNFSDAGDGTLTISGGSFATRTGIKLGDATHAGQGTFAVLGSTASEIAIAGANDDSDGFWEQHSGSVLQVGIDFGGVTPILIKDSAENTSGTSATFANGALLDVDYHNLTEGGGTWTVLEVENGDIIDQGLTFAPGVDTSIWSFTIDNSGPNGRLLLTAQGDPLGHALTIGNTPQQKMRYGMDYERLWYWTGGLNGSERDQIARWTTVDADVDFIRVAVNGGYELTEGSYNYSAYGNKILPLMREMQEANPQLKFFASPRPQNEAESGVAWQPYPRWITGATGNNSNFDFDWQKCAEYLVRYLLLMKNEGFQISFLDITNEWQSNVGGGRLTQDDMDNIHEYLNVTYFENPWNYSEVEPDLFLAPEDIPLIVAPSSWNYSQGRSWISNLDSGDKEAIAIAASHNTDRTGDAQSFAATARAELGDDVEIWNTEVHGWKSTSNENETTSFYYYLEAVRAGFGGLNGWLAIGTTNQGHSYILNPSGTPQRNVKYHIFQKLSSTSNYGHALDILEEPDLFTAPLGSNDDDIPRNVAAFIKGNLMTVWIVNENAASVPLIITPSGRTIEGSSVRRTHWIDPAEVEGFVSYEAVTSGTSFASTIPGESVCCFEILLDGEDFAPRRFEAEDYSHQWGTGTETASDVDGGENICHTNHGDFLRFGSVALATNATVSFRAARPNGGLPALIRVREGSAEGPVLGEVAVPETGGWQNYETLTTTLSVPAGIYNLYLEFAEEAADPAGGYLMNLNWFSVNEDTTVLLPVTGLTASATGSEQIDLNWEATEGAGSYTVKRATASEGPFLPVAEGLLSPGYADSGLSPETTYYYVVSATFAGEAGPDSAIASATTEAEAVIIDPAKVVIANLTLGLDGTQAEQLSFTVEESQQGVNYQVYGSDTMEANDWEAVGPVFAGNGGLLEIEVLFNYSATTNAKHFFRLQATVE